MTLTNKSSGSLLNSLALALALSLAIGAAEAATAVGTVKNLSGYLLVRKGDGSMKVLAEQSRVESGDTLVSEDASYARVQFIDLSEVTMGPKTELKIEAFSYDAAKPENDRATLVLNSGSLMASSGAVAKRSPDKSSLATPVGTIAGSATVHIEFRPVEPATNLTQFMRSSLAMGSSTMNDGPVEAALRDAISALNAEQAKAPWLLAQIAPLGVAPKAPAALAPGLYISVLDGQINLSNKGGSQSFTAGQFGYTANVTKPPVIVPANPGIKFTPPATFASNSGGGSGGGSKAAAVDCVVR